jgi:hypothetical protein
MKLISDKEVRRQVANALKLGKKKFTNVTKDDLSLKQIDQMSNVLKEFRRKSNTDAIAYLQDELTIAYLSILALVVTWYAMSVYEVKGGKPLISKKWINSKGKPDPNLVLRAMLLQIVNYSLAVVRLVEDGLDNPARCVLRALNELSYQFLVLASDSNKMAAYVGMKKSAEAKQVWYELFAKKGRLTKAIADLERRIGVPESVISEFHAYREETSAITSEAVHHSFTSTVVLAHAGDFMTDEAFLALFGRAAPASNLTLDALNTNLFYTFSMFLNVLIEVHGFKASRKDRLWREMYLWNECLGKVNTSENGSRKL